MQAGFGVYICLGRSTGGVLFLGTLFATKCVAWSGLVLAAAAARPRYLPFLYGGAGGRVARKRIAAARSCNEKMAARNNCEGLIRSPQTAPAKLGLNFLPHAILQNG